MLESCFFQRYVETGLFDIGAEFNYLIGSIIESGRQTAYHTSIKLLYRKCVACGDTVAYIVAVRICFSLIVKIILILVRDVLQYCYCICN